MRPKSFAPIVSAFFACWFFFQTSGNLTLAFGASAPTIALDSDTWANLAKRVVPSVVNISTLSTIKSPFAQGSPDDLFRRFFEEFFGRGFRGNPHQSAPGQNINPHQPTPRGQGGLPKAISLGTGFIIDPSGLILTNNHVVVNAEEIKIVFTETPGEKGIDGTVVGRDPEMDVALIRVKTDRELVPLHLGNSDALDVGELVIAVGNPFGQGHSVTHGMISAKGRIAPEFPLATYLQTDAPINPGNSGGPLVNLKGEVIGINNAIEARAYGIGFAIPINPVARTLVQLRTKGTVSRGYIGILIDELTPEVAQKIGAPKDLNAPFVTQVYPKEPADVAGIKPYDVVIELGNKPIHSGMDMITAVTAIPVGETVPIKVMRDGKEMTFKIKVGERPTQESAHKQNQNDDPLPKGHSPSKA